MLKRRDIPIALTIAGSDSGGGAGIQADLKTFASLGVHGSTAVTCITAQNPKSLRATMAIRPDMVRAQIEAVFAELPPRAAKTGMLFSARIVRLVADTFRIRRSVPLIVDPVMVATSGARLLNPSAVRVLQDELLPLATLITPNLPEAEVLLRRKLESVEDLRAAAKELHHRFGTAIVVKGGHLGGLREVVDFFNDGTIELLLSAPRTKGVKTHGTGCTFSAAVTAYLALGYKLPAAVGSAKSYITTAISRGRWAGNHFVLRHG